jgi:predicted metal-dependent phosphoesterase TrpH
MFPLRHLIATPALRTAGDHASMSSSYSQRRGGGGLLCELHAHSRWSDGDLEIDTLVDLYGRAGFDVLCVTDHVVRDHALVTADVHGAYLADICAAADRAASTYGMLVLPGLELTWDDELDERAAHAVAVGLERFVSLEDGLDAAVETARDHGAAIIAAHPYGDRRDPIPGRTTQRWWRDPSLRRLAHRFELINRTQVFDWVAEEDLPVVANGDFHRLPHLFTWKSVVPTEPDAEAVIAYLRSAAPVLLTRPELPALAPSAGAVAA